MMKQLRFLSVLQALVLSAVILYGEDAWCGDVTRVEAYVRNSSTGRSVFWVDNDTLVFHGAPILQDGTVKRGEWLLEYKVSTGKVREQGRIGSLCFDNGYIRYWRPTPETADLPLTQQKPEVFYGPYGKETQMPPPLVKKTNAPSARTWDCKYEDELPSLPAWTKGKVVKRLRPEHGFVEAAPISWMDVRLAKLYPSSGGQADIPLRALDLPISLTTEYYPFKNAYLFTSSYHRTPLPSGVPQNLWWLYPDGRLEEIATIIRDEKNWPLTNVDVWNFVISRQGIYFSGAEPNITPRIGKSGLYRLKPGGQPEKIVDGRIGSKAVSPDGCKIAFGNDDRWLVEGNKQLKLQIIDVCKGETK